MKVNFKVKMSDTIEFLVEIYFKTDLHFFEKYFTWGNIQPSRDFLDSLYILQLRLNNMYMNNFVNINKSLLANQYPK